MIRRAQRRLLALLFGLLVACVLLEAGLRCLRFSFPKFCRADPEVGHVLRPGAEGWCRDEGDAYMAVNALGMRDRPRTVAREPGVFRIALLGDSFMEARQVDYRASLPALLEQGLEARGRRVEVLNFGCTGYTTGQELLFLRHRLPPFRPDLVLLAFFPGNDVPDNVRTPHSDPIRPYFRLEGGQLVRDDGFRSTFYQQRDANPRYQTLYALSDRSRAVQLAASLVTGPSAPAVPAPVPDPTGRVGPDDPVWVEPRDARWREAWAVTDALLLEMNAQARALGAALAVFEVPGNHDGDPDPAHGDELRAFFGAADLEYPKRRVEVLLAKARVPYLSLTPIFRAEARGRRVHLNGFARTRCLGRGHWNEDGHRVAAVALLPWLARMLPAR